MTIDKITISLSQDDDMLLRNLAERKGIDRGELATEIVEEFLDKQRFE